MYWQIAIDGPAAAGKSTIARLLAKRLNFSYLDTGAMYRAITYKALTLKINMEEEAEYNFLQSTSIDFFNEKLYLDGTDVSNEIRTVEVTNNAWLPSKFGYVRSKLVNMQRKIAESKNIIMDGRDIGTVVLPDANLKIYLVANLDVRARRRFKERQDANINQLSFEDTVAEIEKRDNSDMSRLISPLAKAPDAVEIDTSDLNIDEVVDKITQLVMERGYEMENVKTTKNKTVEKDITAGTDEKADIALESATEEKVAKKPKAKTAKKETTEATEVAEVVAKEEPVKKTTKKATKKEVETEEVTEEKPVKKTTKKAEEVTEEKPVKKTTKKVEEKPAKEVEKVVQVIESEEENSNDDDDNFESAEDLDENADTTPVNEEKDKKQEFVRETQLVEGTVKDILKAQIERVNLKGEVVKSAKEEKLLIELDNGQEGFLFRKEIADINDEDDLEDIFMEGERISAIVKRVYPDGGRVLLSTVLVKRRENIHKFEEIIENHGFFNAKVVKSIKVGLILQYEDFPCLLPNSQIDVAPENYKDLIGTEITVAPIRVDYNRVRLIVSNTVANAIKHRKEKEEFLKTVKVGQDFEGVVKNIESYGAFIEIVPGVEGLLHISEIEHNRIVKVEKVINIGDKVNVKVIKVDGNHIGLSRKALLPNHWKLFMDTNKVDDLINGKVIEINKSGVVLSINENVQGFLPKSEFSWERNTFIEDYLEIGDEIEVKIIELDLTKKRIILSRKQLVANPWETLKLRGGDKVEAKVIKVLNEGVKVDVEGASGFLRKSDFGNVTEFTPGETIEAKVKIFDPSRTNLLITLRNEVTMDRNAVSKLLKSQEKVTSTFGDFIDLDEFKKNRKKR